MSLVKVNVDEVARQVIGLVRRFAGMRIEIDVNGTKLLVDGATSPIKSFRCCKLRWLVDLRRRNHRPRYEGER